MKKFLQKLLVTVTASAALAQPVAIMASEAINEDLISHDFYEAINGAWVEEAEIPEDDVQVGAFVEIDEGIRDTLKADLDAMLIGDLELTDDQATMVDFYGLALDTQRRDQEGYDALSPYIEAIDQLESMEDLNTLTIEWGDKGLPTPFNLAVSPSMSDATVNALYAAGPSTFLPDKSIYEDPTQRLVIQGLFESAVNEGLGLIGYSEEEATAIIEDSRQIDMEIAKYSLSAEESADVSVLDNPVAYRDFIAYSEIIDLKGFLTSYLPDAKIDEILVAQPDYYENIDTIFNEDNLDQVKAWLLVNLVLTAAPYLTEDLRAAIDSYSMALMGTGEIVSVQDHAYDLTNLMFGDVLGDYYGKTYFGQEAKDEVEEITSGLLAIYEDKLAKNDWMSEETKVKAIEKLDTMALQIGYSEEYPEVYQEIEVNSDQTLFDNVLAMTEVFVKDTLADYEEPVDRETMMIPAHVVNAFYSPQQNAIVFPAGILSAPFYSEDQTYAENLGGIGVVIAHEITHAFDNNGSKFDSLGNYSDWWTAEDYAIFEEKSQAFIDLWDGMPYANGAVNGQLTVGENIADLGGLSNALLLLEQSSEVNYEEFFENYARIWRSKLRPEYEDLLLMLDTHSPNKLRVNIPLQQIDQFYETYGITEGDDMYTAPEDRVSLW